MATPLYRDNAVVLRTYRLGEADRIVVLLTEHHGKVPTRALERKSLYDRLTKLELDLTEAIKSERYEDAARTRDEISRVKQAFDTKPKAAR